MYKHKKFGDKFQEHLPTIKRPPVKLKDLLKKKKEQHESLQYRHDMIQANKRQNYINGYDRINGILTNNIAHGHVSAAYLTNRKNRIKELFDESFEDKKHELYNN